MLVLMISKSTCILTDTELDFHVLT
jgi:hypothetical protein